MPLNRGFYLFLERGVEDSSLGWAVWVRVLGDFLFEVAGWESTGNLQCHECTGFQIIGLPILVVFPMAHPMLPRRLTSGAGHTACNRVLS